MMRGIAIAVIGGVLCFLLSEMGSRLAKPIGAICAVIALLTAVSGVSGIATEIKALTDGAGISEVGLDVMRIVGVGYVFGSCSDTLDALGEGGISRALDTVCCIEITLIAFPYALEIIAFGLSLIK